MRTPHPWILPQLPTAVRDLRAAGVTRTMIATQIRLGSLIRIRDGVYLDARSWPSEAGAQHLLKAQAEQQLHPQAAVSHASAALAWGLPSPPLQDWALQPPTLTVPTGDSLRSRGVSARFRCGTLPSHHLTRHHSGALITTPSRTAVDVAVGLDLPDALVVLDAAVRMICEAMVTTPRRADYGNQRLVAAAVTTMREAAGHGRGMVGVVNALGMVDPRRETPIESLSAGHFHLAGLPTPQCQVPIRTRWGVLFPDFLWSAEGVIGEADGAVKYRDPQAIVREKEREQVLGDLGFTVVRWLGKEIVLTPEDVIERVRRALCG